MRKDFFQKRILKQKQQIKSERLIKLCQKFYFYSKHHLLPSPTKATSEDDDSDRENFKLNKQNPSKRHRLSNLPKFITNLSNNPKVKRNSSLPPVKRTSSNQNQDSDKATDTISSLVTHINHLIVSHNNN